MRFLAGALIALVGCYDAPRPSCGFWCGPAGECPSGYLCNSDERRCFPNGQDPAALGSPCPDAGLGPDGPDNLQPMIMNVYADCAERPRYSCVRIEFSERVVDVSETTLFIRDDGDAAVQGRITLSDVNSYTFARIQFDDSLDIGREYRVYATSEIRDLQNNHLDSTFRNFSFTPRDVSITGRTPGRDATLVEVNTTIAVLFNQNVPALNLSTFQLSTGFDPVTGSVISDVPLTLGATFEPTKQLSPNTNYFVNLAVIGLPPESMSWSFTTGDDNVPPGLARTTPVDGSVDVVLPTNISISFDELTLPPDAADMVVSAGGTPVPGTVTTTDAGQTWLFTPSSPLAVGATYAVQALDATDSQNNVAPIYNWSFVTAP